MLPNPPCLSGGLLGAEESGLSLGSLTDMADCWEEGTPGRTGASQSVHASIGGEGEGERGRHLSLPLQAQAMPGLRGYTSIPRVIIKY